MSGLPGVTLVIGGNVKAPADQLIDQARRPPEPRYGQAHDQQEGVAPGTAKILKRYLHLAVTCVTDLPGTRNPHDPSAYFETLFAK